MEQPSAASEVYAKIREWHTPGSSFSFWTKDLYGALPHLSSGQISGAVTRLVTAQALTVEGHNKKNRRFSTTDFVNDKRWKLNRKRPKEHTRSRRSGYETGPHTRGKELESAQSLQECLLRVAGYFDNPLKHFTTLELQRELLRRAEEA